MGKNRRNTNTTPSKLSLSEEFLQDIEDWSAGYGEYEEIFTEEEREFIRNNTTLTEKPLYRIADLPTHYENGEMVIESDPKNWKKGDQITFHGEMKSFSTSEDSVLDFGGDTTNPLVIYRTNGSVENFPIEQYTKGYSWLHETLVPGDGWKVENVTDVTDNKRYQIQHKIGNEIHYQKRPIYIVDISR